MHFFAHITMFPLQNVPLKYWWSNSESNPATKYVLIGMGVAIAILIIYNVIKGNRKSKGGYNETGGPRHYSGLALHRATSYLGLDREQTKMLDYVLRSGGITDPMRLINSPDLMDRHFKRTYRLIERVSATNEELNDRLSLLFATRNLIESHSSNDPETSRHLPENTPAVLIIEKDEYPVKILSSKGDMLKVEHPKNSRGAFVQLQRGSKAILTIFTKSSKGFIIETRVMGSEKSRNGPVLLLAHSGQIKKLSNRRFRRRDMSTTAIFFFVHLDSKTKKMMVDKRQLSGTLTDISIGGCSIKTRISVNQGQHLKIEFAHAGSDTITALGEVLRISKVGTSALLHIRFLKIPRKSLNAINALVYEYANG